MNEDFGRMMRALDSQAKHQADNELADMRRWYYGMQAGRRAQFKQHVQRLADAAKKCALDWNMYVNVRFSWTWPDDEGALVQRGGNQPPQQILRAIAQWDESERFFPND
jgi:hypothetical protein